MIVDSFFMALNHAAENKELLLVDGGMCWYKITDNILHIYILIATKTGMGSYMLGILKKIEGIKKITLCCPKELPSNDWYVKKGFKKISENNLNNLYELTLEEKE